MILTQGDSARILTLSQRMEGRPTLTFPQGEKHTHFYPLTQKGKKTHSSSLSQGMEEALTDPITLSHRGDSPLTLILSY